MVEIFLKSPNVAREFMDEGYDHWGTPQIWTRSSGERHNTAEPLKQTNICTYSIVVIDLIHTV